MTKKEAINIALKEIETYSYKLVNGSEISGFGVREDHITTKLLTRPVGSQLYPYWAVEVGLDDLYPGNIYAIRVNIWAGTSEVFDCYELGIGGSIPILDSEIDNQPSSQIDNNNTPIYAAIFVGLTALTIGVITAILILKKKRK